MARTYAFKEDLSRDGYSREEAYFYRLNRDLIRRRQRPQLSETSEVRKNAGPGELHGNAQAEEEPRSGRPSWWRRLRRALIYSPPGTLW